MGRLDPLRHLSVFSPHAFGKRRVDVIGAGATGSRVVMDLAKLGIDNIHAWDFDLVEEHNIANQLYTLGQVKMFKVDALKANIKIATGTEIQTHVKRVDGSQSFGEIVFLLTDTMESRKEIWDRALKFRLKTRLMIETRMGADNGRVYTINPNKLSHIKEWENTLYIDKEAEVSACGASTTVGPTAEMIAGLAVWQMIRWFNFERGSEDQIENEIIFSLRPMLMLVRRSF